MKPHYDLYIDDALRKELEDAGFRVVDGGWHMDPRYSSSHFCRWEWCSSIDRDDTDKGTCIFITEEKGRDIDMRRVFHKLVLKYAYEYHPPLSKRDLKWPPEKPDVPFMGDETGMEEYLGRLINEPT